MFNKLFYIYSVPFFYIFYKLFFTNYFFLIEKINIIKETIFLINL